MKPVTANAQAYRQPATCFCMCVCLSLVIVAGGQGAPPLDPLPVPEYSFDVVSLAAVEGHVACGDVLTLEFPYPESALSGAMLGLISPLDDLDALSAANASVLPDDVFSLLFSVDRETAGGARPEPKLVRVGVPYNTFDQSWRGQAAGDQFMSTRLFRRMGSVGDAEQSPFENNYLVRNNYDEGGTDFSARPPTHADDIVESVPQDRVDATARLARLEQNGAIANVYFSLTTDSPSLAIVPILPCAAGPSGANIFFACEPAVVTGACCHDDDTCEIIGEFECGAPRTTWGTWLGPDTTCDMCNVPPQSPGTCCFNDGTCAVLPELACYEAFGWWLGPDATCDMCNAPSQGQGACCFDGGTCEMLTEPACYEAFGWWLGPDSTCNMCNQEPQGQGACCHDDGTCEIAMEFECEAPGTVGWGIWLGPDTTCDMCTEPEPTAACCLPDGSCTMISSGDCDLMGGLFLPDEICLGDWDENWIDDACEGRSRNMLVMLYASYQELRLVPADDIDALIVFDVNENGYFDDLDQVLFSLSPGSPSLAMIVGASVEAAAADVFVVTVGQPPAVFATAAELGLGGPRSNIDALDFHRLDSTLRRGGLQHAIRASSVAEHIDFTRVSPVSSPLPPAPPEGVGNTKVPPGHKGGEHKRDLPVRNKN
ncbi:MAG: hypothetical protein KAV82_00215 [Phycisphaerae bacterium]|nr:hypothetical protein [Phycisphaerae bacterium]